MQTDRKRKKITHMSKVFFLFLLLYVWGQRKRRVRVIRGGRRLRDDMNTLNTHMYVRVNVH